MKKILIIGSTGGIGQGLCKNSPEEYQIYITGRNADKVKELQENLKEMGKDTVPVIFDVNDKSEMENRLQDIENIDAVIYNVGILKDQLLCDIEENDWNMIIQSNYQAAVNLYEIIKDKLSKGAVFTAICSISGVKGRPGQGAYSVSKAMLIKWIEVMSQQDKETSFFAVSPGPVKTDLIKKSPWYQDEQAVKRIPLKRYAEPAEIAQFVYTLVQNKDCFTSGKNYILDGGFVETIRTSK